MLKDLRISTNLTQEEPKGASSIFEKRIWNIRDVAVYTEYSIGTLYNLTSRNLIPHVKKRGKLRFIPLDIQNWIEEGDIE